MGKYSSGKTYKSLKRGNRSTVRRKHTPSKKAENENQKVIDSLSFCEFKTNEINQEIENISGVIADGELEKETNSPKEIDELLLGRRVVNLGYMLKEYGKAMLHPLKCNKGKMTFIKEVSRGLYFTLKFKCIVCHKVMFIKNDPHGPDLINEDFVWGSLSIGIGQSQSEELLAVIDVPSMSSPTFSKYTNNIHKNWESRLRDCMRQAGEEERVIAESKGHVNERGIPYITVVGDGGWSKRSYGHGYRASSGVGIIIGEATKKPLFVGVKNKFCATCNYHENKGTAIKPHNCFRNHQGTSTSMETDIIIEGFNKSLEQHGIMYKYYIGDGDSSVFSAIKEKVSYGREVVKIECANHMTRNMCVKLHKLSKNTKFSLTARKVLLADCRISRLIKGVRTSIKKAGEDRDIAKLRKAIKNAPYHIFGSHSDCNNSFCQRKEEENLIPSIESNFLQEIFKIIDPLIQKADVLTFNKTTNEAVRYMSLLAKFVGGKRVNYTRKDSYTTRAYGAALCHFGGPAWHQLAELPNKTKGKTLNKLIRKRHQKRMRSLQYVKKRTYKPSSGPDKFYKGNEAADPDMTEEQLKNTMENFLQTLYSKVATEGDKNMLQERTIGQHQNKEWRETRKNLLTASNFGRIIKRREKTHCHKLVKALLYPKDFVSPAILYGMQNEAVAIKKYEKQLGITVDPCGIFVDPKYPFLGASPDGLTPDNGLVEVKCLPSISSTFLDANKKNLCFQILEGRPRLKIGHNFYYQIQGQLNIAKRDYCDLIMYCDYDFHIERIYRDETIWFSKMVPKLEQFYKNKMLPEIVDPRVPRGLQIRDGDDN